MVDGFNDVRRRFNPPPPPPALPFRPHQLRQQKEEANTGQACAPQSRSPKGRRGRARRKRPSDLARPGKDLDAADHPGRAPNNMHQPPSFPAEARYRQACVRVCKCKHHAARSLKNRSLRTPRTTGELGRALPSSPKPLMPARVHRAPERKTSPPSVTAGTCAAQRCSMPAEPRLLHCTCCQAPRRHTCTSHCWLLRRPRLRCAAGAAQLQHVGLRHWPAPPSKLLPRL